MKKVLPIGVSDFEKLISSNYYYVDKTLMIASWLDTATEVTLITRPRRFGKTLAMTMLREFFDMTRDSRRLFDGLAIMDTPYASEMNQYPVIFLSFKDCKNDQETMLRCLYRQLLLAYQLAYATLSPDAIDAIRLERILAALTTERTQETSAINDSIYFLSKLLHQATGKKVIILIDEYDTPMINAYEQGYYEAVRALFVSLYGTALKDNPHLERAMLTGIHRIAKENIFSGLNNLSTCTVVTEKYQSYFGLTPSEAQTLLADYGLALTEQVTAMYNGYLFGGQPLYNPWSLINYADSQRLEAYWVNTASNELLVGAIAASQQQVQHDLESLLTQGHAVVPMDLQTSFFELAQPATLWGLFLNSGYLTVSQTPEPNEVYTWVRIPNQEVMTSFRRIVERYGGFAANSLDYLFGALLRRDMAAFTSAYEQILLTCTSFHDGSTENAYHMLFLGMCVYLSGDYRVSSNIESGHGRADIRLEAKRSGKPHFIIEFKQGEDLDRLAQEALAQIKEKRYDSGLTGEILLLGIVHNKKKCRVVSEAIHQ